MNLLFGGVGRAAAVMGVLGLVGCGSVTPPAIPDGRGSDAPPIDGPIIDGPPIDGPPIDGPPIDGMVPVVKKFDFGFIDEYTIAWNFAGTGFSGIAAIANTSAAPLNLTKLTVVSVTDDDPEVVSEFVQERASETPLAPGNAAGQLAGQAYVRIVDSNLMTEPNVDESLLFELRFPNFKEQFIGRAVHVRATIRIDDGEITLPMTVNFTGQQVTLVDHASRLSAQQVVAPN